MPKVKKEIKEHLLYNQALMMTNLVRLVVFHHNLKKKL